MRFGVPPRYGFLVIALRTLFRNLEVSACNFDASFVFCVPCLPEVYIWRVEIGFAINNCPAWEGGLRLYIRHSEK